MKIHDSYLKIRIIDHQHFLLHKLSFIFSIVGDFGAIFPDSSQPISKEIEDEANSYFQRIYNHSPHSSLPIDEVLEMLKRFQDSPVKRERVCICTLEKFISVLFLYFLKIISKNISRILGFF